MTTMERLSTLDASFLAVERPTAHMHVGWKAVFEPPANGDRPTFEDLRAHIGARLNGAPRWRQRLAEVPLGAHHPVWVDDPEFDLRRHVRRAPPGDLDDLVADVMSEPLHRDRPLWEMWVADELPDGSMGMVGKAHHCMVDGLGAVELTSMLLDMEPDAGDRAVPPPAAAPLPGRLELLAGAVRDRIADQLRMLASPARLLPTPERLRSVGGALERTARAVGHAVAPLAPPSPLNRDSSPHRELAQTCRDLDELREVKRAFHVTVNDVLLAAVAGALRSFMVEQGREPPALKAMVPVSVRDAGDVLGSHISFLFVRLPCQLEDPIARLASVARQMRVRKDAGEPQGADAALHGAGYAPRFVQSALAQVLASPRVFNLVVSNVPGPPVPLYLKGCRLDRVYPVVPLAREHGLSVGMMTVAGRACFGLYADRKSLPDAPRLAEHLDAAVDELLAEAHQHGEVRRE